MSRLTRLEAAAYLRRSVKHLDRHREAIGYEQDGRNIFFALEAEKARGK